MTVEGVDYTPAGIEEIRTELAKLRDLTFDQWPKTIGQTLVLSHAIALLAHLKELTEREAAE